MLPLLRTYAMGLFFALDCLHKKGVTHTDIKLGNTAMVNGKVILLDFGAAEDSNRPTVKNIVGSSLRKISLPHTGTTSFRPFEIVINSNFVAPGTLLKTLKKQNRIPFLSSGKCFVICSAQDMYAAGITLFALILGTTAVYHVPHDGDTNFSLVGKMSNFYGADQMITAFKHVGMIFCCLQNNQVLIRYT